MIVIDRFEGDFCILESDENVLVVAKKYIPSDAHEGDILIETNGIYKISKLETEKRKSNIESMFENLKKK